MATPNMTHSVPSWDVPRPSYGYLVLVIVPLITVFGNGLMILAVVMDKKLKSSVTNRYTAALAFADLLIGLIPMPFAVYVKVNGDHWDLGVSLCRLYTAFDVAGSTASILHLVLISGDRYLAVMWPHEYQRYSKRASIAFPIILVWLISASLSIPIVMGKSILNAEFCWLESPEFQLYSSLLSFFIPASVLTLMYVKIFRKLNRHKGIRTMLRASGAADTGAPFHLPLVVVQEVSYAQPPPSTNTNNNNNDVSADKTSCSASIKGPNQQKRASRVSSNFDPGQKSGSPCNRISPPTCLCSSSPITDLQPRINRSKTCPDITDPSQLLGSSQQLHPDAQGTKSLLQKESESRNWTTDTGMPSQEDEESIPDIDAPTTSHHTFHLWTHLRHSQEGRHRLVDDDDEEEEEQNQLLPNSSSPDHLEEVKRPSPRMERRPCVVATRRFSLWLDEDEVCQTSDSLAALDTAKSKLVSDTARRYLDALRPSSSKSHLIVNQFDSNVWVEEKAAANHQNGPISNGKPFDQRHNDVYTLPPVAVSRAGSTFRKLATRLTSVMQRKTEKQAIVKEKKATKLVAMILGTCGVFIISWLPFFTFNIMRGICLSITDSVSECDWLPSTLFFLTTWLGYANSGFNPIIYGLVNEQFRRTYKRLIRWPSKSRHDRWSL